MVRYPKQRDVKGTADFFPNRNCIKGWQASYGLIRPVSAANANESGAWCEKCLSIGSFQAILQAADGTLGGCRTKPCVARSKLLGHRGAI